MASSRSWAAYNTFYEVQYQLKEARLRQISLCFSPPEPSDTAPGNNAATGTPSLTIQGMAKRIRDETKSPGFPQNQTQPDHIGLETNAPVEIGAWTTLWLQPTPEEQPLHLESSAPALTCGQSKRQFGAHSLEALDAQGDGLRKLFPTPSPNPNARASLEVELLGHTIVNLQCASDIGLLVHAEIDKAPRLLATDLEASLNPVGDLKLRTLLVLAVIVGQVPNKGSAHLKTEYALMFLPACLQ